MSFNLRSLFLLKHLSKQKSADNKHATNSPAEPATRNRRERFSDWLSPKPEAIKLFPGEIELFRKGLILVTDTRLAYIDPFDRMLKTYMFEHMISVHKQFYRTTLFNRRLCKGLLIISLLVLLIILTIDLLDSNSSGFFLIYMPLLASIVLGVKVWNDMKPRYVIHWRMSDLTYGEIVQEPMLRERILGSNKREDFMNALAEAMNQALSGKSWWPDHNAQVADDTAPAADTANRPALKLVTDSYQ